MGDPELRSDETILLRTPGIFVKSIAFEGYLTNKRIILIDRIKNLLPQKEIPLVTIKDIEPGENAIRDQIITLTILAKSGETRQIILTFSRQTGGNRIRERNEWVRLLKENTSSSIDQVIRRMIPGAGPVAKKPEPAVPPRIEVITPPVSKKVPPAAKPPIKKVVESVPPAKKIIESRPESTPPLAIKEVSSSSAPGFGTYCSRCGNRVPEGSGFCNRCGSQIVVPGSIAVTQIPTATVFPPADSATMTGRIIPSGTDIQTTTRIEYPTITESPNLPPEVPGEPLEETSIPPEQETAVPHKETKWSGPEGSIPDSNVKPGTAATEPAGELPSPQKPTGGFNVKLSKNAVIALVLAIIIAVIAVSAFFLYPAISESGSAPSGNVSALAAGPTIIKPVATTIKNAGTAVFQDNTLKLTTLPTTRPAPGNSGSKVGL